MEHNFSNVTNRPSIKNCKQIIPPLSQTATPQINNPSSGLYIDLSCVAKAVPTGGLITHPGLGLLFFSSFLLLPHQLISPGVLVGKQLTTQTAVASGLRSDTRPSCYLNTRIRAGCVCELPRTIMEDIHQRKLETGFWNGTLTEPTRNGTGVERRISRRRGCKSDNKPPRPLVKP